jgi:MSHA biogenesis protein MshM
MNTKQRAFFGFSRRPFTTHSADEPWLDEERSAHFKRLEQLVERGGFALIHGAPGCGKTRILKHLIGTLNTNCHQPVYIPHSTLNESGMLQTLAWQLGIEPSNSRPRNIQRITKHINDSKQIPVIILDELQHASHQTLEAMRLLCEAQLTPSSPIPVILTGTDEFVGLLTMKVCESLRQRITLCINIKPLTKEQVPRYINHHLELAQAHHEIISPPALKLITETTGAIPRLIEHLTRNALEIAADDQSQTVELRHVDQATKLTLVTASIPELRI